MDTSISTTQTKGALLQITIIDQGRSELDKEEKIPKEKEQQAIQTLANLPIIGTPIETSQQSSTELPL